MNGVQLFFALTAWALASVTAIYALDAGDARDRGGPMLVAYGLVVWVAGILAGLAVR